MKLQSKNFVIMIFLVLTALVIKTSCVHNYEPVIYSLIAKPNIVYPGGQVYLVCSASDDDQLSVLKSDDLEYEWTAAYGALSAARDTTIDNVRDSAIYIAGDTIIILIGDTTISYPDSIRMWTAPQDSGYYSITCTVSDLFGGYDVNTINVMVE